MTAQKTLTLQKTKTRSAPFGIEFVALVSYDGWHGVIVAEWENNDGDRWDLSLNIPSFAPNAPYNCTASASCERTLSAVLTNAFGLSRPDTEVSTKLWQEACKRYPRCTAAESYYGL